jgi:hypothetical protein
MNLFNGNDIKLFNMIFLMIGDFEPFTLFKVVNKKDLIQEEIYCIKEPYKEFCHSYKNEYYNKIYNVHDFDKYLPYYALFKYYDYGPFDNAFTLYGLYSNYKTKLCACFEYADSRQLIFDDFDKDFPIIIYRSVTKEEYYLKLKEKYDHKCLNIILKRLVDETFQSDFL